MGVRVRVSVSRVSVSVGWQEACLTRCKFGGLRVKDDR